MPLADRILSRSQVPVLHPARLPTLPTALVLIVRVPVATPAATGVNVTEMVQEPAGKIDVQLFALTANGPLMTGAAIFRNPVPLLVMTSVCAALVATSISGKNVKLLTFVLKTGVPVALISSENCCVAFGNVPLAACAVRGNVPAAVGVPKIIPGMLQASVSPPTS